MFRRVGRFLRSYFLFFAIVIAYLVIDRYSVQDEGWVFLFLRRIGTYGFVVLGASIVAQADSYDLSVGVRMLLNIMVSTYLVVALKMPIYPALLISFLLCILLGMGYGVFLTKTGAPLILFSFAMIPVLNMACAGIDKVILSATVNFTEKLRLLNGSIVGVPVVFIVFCATLAAVWCLYNYTTWGRALYAVGVNSERTARSGINVNAVRIFAYTLSSVLIFASGLFFVAWVPEVRNGTFQGYSGIGYEVLFAVCLGRVYRGSNNAVFGAFIGVIGMSLVNSLLILHLEWYIPPVSILGVLSLLLLLSTKKQALK